MASRSERLVELYVGGLSIPQVSEEIGLSQSTVRYHLKAAGVLRSRSEGVKAAAKAGRLGSGFRGKQRTFTQEHKLSIKAARQKWGQENAKGYRINSGGYKEFTKGPHKGRSEHVVVMEERLGRPLLNNEEVHHIDRDRLNNDPDNLALCTCAGHARLHRFEDALQGKARERNPNGTWS